MKLQRPGIRSSLRAWRSDAASEPTTHEKTESPVGVLLRASRLRCGEDLTGVAQVLRIRRNYLEALEEGRFGDLPGATYAVGFVRTYAEHLGLDGDEVVRRFKAEASGIKHSTALVFPSPTTEGGIPGGALMLVGALLAILAYGGWYVLSTQNQTVVELVPELPDRLISLVDNVRTSLSGAFSGTEAATTDGPSAAPALVVPPRPVTPPQAAEPPQAATASPVVAPPAASVPPQAATPPVAPAAAELPVSMARAEAGPPPAQRAPATNAAHGQPTGGETRAAAVPAIPTAPSTPPAIPGTDTADRQVAGLVENPEPHASASAASGGTADDGAVRIVVRAKTDSWIQIRDEAGNQLLLTRLMRAGDTYDVPNRAGLKLLTGNAGALDILVDGEATPSLGPLGAVRRDISLNADLLRAGTAARP